MKDVFENRYIQVYLCIGIPLSVSVIIAILVCVVMDSDMNKHLSLLLLITFCQIWAALHHIVTTYLQGLCFIEEGLISENVYLILPPPHTHKLSSRCTPSVCRYKS